MPNFRALMTMPADGGDLVRAIKRDEFIREYERHVAQYPQRDPALTAFERGDHAPAPAVLERAARLSGWTAHSGDACPVPHGTMVEIRTRGGSTGSEIAESYSWRTDGTHHDIVEWRLATQKAAEAPKVGGWVMHNCAAAKPSNLPEGDAWFVTPNRVTKSRIRFDLVKNWHLVVAYSTDAECPPWPEAK